MSTRFRLSEEKKLIEDKFAACKSIILDTPEWNIRTNSFYKKCGYVSVGTEHTSDFDLIVYEKTN